MWLSNTEPLAQIVWEGGWVMDTTGCAGAGTEIGIDVAAATGGRWAG
ncbi:hypothetical protein [Sphingobium terrigena]|nr:hypothetical protein [Sphingobium terrigena]